MDIEYKDDKSVPFEELSPGQTFLNHGRLYIKCSTESFGLVISPDYSVQHFAVDLENGTPVIFTTPADKVQVCNAKVIVEN